MDYIISSLHFDLKDTSYCFLLKRESIIDGLLSQDTFNEICQYLTELTNTPAPTPNKDLTTDTVMTALMSYPLSIGFGLCTNFQTFDTYTYGWSTTPKSSDDDLQKENENG